MLPVVLVPRLMYCGGAVEGGVFRAPGVAMSCFCHRTIAPLQVQLRSARRGRSGAAAVPVSPRQALAEALAQELARALAALGFSRGTLAA